MLYLNLNASYKCHLLSLIKIPLLRKLFVKEVFFMYKRAILFLLFIVILSACTNTQENSQNNNKNTDTNTDTQPMHYEREKTDVKEDDGAENQRRNGHREPRYSDAFTNEESVELSKRLEKQKNIVKAQVASTEDRIIVAVMLNDHSDHNITRKIESEVKKTNPDKQIVIYTDDSHWDRMKNLDARMKSGSIGNGFEDNIKGLFNIND